MDQLFIFLILGIVTLLFGAFLGNFFARLKNKTETSKLEERLTNASMQAEKLNVHYGNIVQEKEILRKEKESLNLQLARQSAEFDNLNSELEREKELFKNFEKDFNDKFENLAQKILESKSEKFTKQNKENIDGILKPLQDKIEKFEERVNSANKESYGRHSELKEQIKHLSDLNQKIGTDAENLTKALKGDSKMQGNWGELVLERVLEKSGLDKDREYFVQNSFTTEEGNRVLPDVVLHLPDNKKMIIDSKVSLNAYERFVNEEDETLRENYLKDHIASLKRHIEQLGAKNYHDIYKIESPDFVLLFVPIEPAFAVAINRENNLYNWAFEKNIVIVTPSTLLATLRTVDSMWKNEKQQQNAIEIATQAGALYDQFTNLTDELIKVGKQIGTVQGSYENAMIKLTGKGNLVGKVEKLKKLGAKATKRIDDKLLKRSEETDFLETE